MNFRYTPGKREGAKKIRSNNNRTLPPHDSPTRTLSLLKIQIQRLIERRPTIYQDERMSSKAEKYHWMKKVESDLSVTQL